MLDHSHKKNTPDIFELDVLSNEGLAKGLYLLSLRLPEGAKSYLPGQFAMVKPAKSPATLLARPYSVYGCERGILQFLYKIYGTGTYDLSRMGPGTSVLVVGPLGNGFVASDAELDLLIAGGIGIAPFPFLVTSFLRVRPAVLFFGNQTSSQIVLEDVFRKLNVTVHHATNDGSFGHHGFVTDVLEDFLSKQGRGQRIHAYVCGPRAMEKRVTGILSSFGIPSQVAMEEYMACGLGVCMGCVIACRSKGSGWTYQRVCMEGPIFSGDEILWEHSG